MLDSPLTLSMVNMPVWYWESFYHENCHTVYYVLGNVCFGSVKWWLWIDITLSVAPVVNSPHCELKGCTIIFSFRGFGDGISYFCCNFQQIIRQNCKAKIFLTRPNFLVYQFKIVQCSVGSLLAAWKAWAEDIFVRTVALKIALKITSWCIVTAAWLKYCLVVFPKFGLHKTMDRVDRVLCLLRFRIKSIKKDS